jgi:putative ABC transport system ATP-binding protein
MINILSVKNLSRSFGDIKSVNDVSFEIRQGEFIGIQGKSGSGKTTLLGLLTGLEKPDIGSIIYGKKDIAKMGNDDLALFRRENIGIIFQSFNLIPTLNVIENIAIPLYPTKDRHMLDLAEENAVKVGLGKRLYHYPNQLSGGEQQRVAIARALINNPKIIFADEPTGNLDEATGKSIIEILKELNENNKVTIVIVTHDDEIARRCHRIIKFKDGEIL